MAADGIFELLLELVRIPSVSPSREEQRVAEVIYDRLAQAPYFRANEGFLKLVPIEGDRLGRQSVCALVRATPPTPRTVIMIGHIDVVDTREARELADLAFDPLEYARQLPRLSLPREARRDLESGEYLFGRGVFDMKGGVAVEVEFLRECSSAPESLDANLMLLLVGDEENQSAGMKSAIKHLVQIQEDLGLDFLACANAEGAAQRGREDVSRYVSVGTVGKMMPVFYCVGRESHVGSYYEGLNANLLASAVNMVLEGSSQWTDSAGSELYPPPTALRHRDLRDVYSVTLPARAVTYFNYLSVSKTPADALAMMRSAADEAFEMALDRLRHSAGRFAANSGTEVDIPWRPKVLTYEELIGIVRASYDRTRRSSVERPGQAAPGEPHSLDTHLESFIAALPDDMDERDKSIAVIGEVLKFYTDKDPVIIVGFLPPYYPHRSNLRKTRRELALIEAVEELIHEARECYGETLVLSEHFTAISDLSYMGFQGTRDDLLALALNTPGWGHIYDLPLDALLRLDVPVVNIGPAGVDAHKYTERLELSYYLEVYPKLFRSLIGRLSRLQ